LKVNVDELGDRAIGLDADILERLAPRIAEADFVLADEDGAATVLQVRLRQLQSGEYDYGVHFEFVDDGHRTPVVDWVECRLCVDETLISILDDRLPAVILALDERAKKLTAESAGDGGEPDDAASMPKPITGLGIGGAIIAGLGVGALIGGGVELSRGVVVESVGEPQRRVTDHRPPGYALVGVGAAALVAGVVMLGVDLAVQSKKRKAPAPAERTHLFPLLTPTSVGIGLAGKF
jgi:hypothetical protein